MINPAKNIVGIIPMAGLASRLGKLPVSKELLPVGNKKEGPKPVSLYLIDSMKHAGVKDIHLVLRNGKWDIPSFYKSGKNFGFNASYHIAHYGYGVPFTINEAFPFIEEKWVVLGFPDIIFKPADVFSSMIKKLTDADTSIVLGSMPVNDPEKWDMVEADEYGMVSEILIKSKKSDHLRYNWFLAAWKPEFTLFLKNFVESLLNNHSSGDLENNEYHLGDVLNMAIQNGIKVKTVVFENGKCLDIGTPENLKLAKFFLN